MSAHCHADHEPFDGNDRHFRGALIAVIIINAVMFLVEVIGGHLAGSQALLADALDFFADAVTYTVSLLVIGRAVHLRSRVAFIKGISLLAMGLWVLGSTLYEVFYMQTPHAAMMGSIGGMALAANLVSVLVLMKWRNGDANIRSVWLCSRNDAIGNVAVLLAALGVFGTGTGWPDLLVAAIMSLLFVNSALGIFRQSRQEAGAHTHTHEES